MKYRSQCRSFSLRSSIKSYWLFFPRFHVYTSKSLQNIRQNHWTMKYRSQWPTFILRSSIKSYWQRYHVYTSNSLQDMRQSHWTMKYRSQWPTFILKSSIKSYWLISPRYHVYTSKSLQDIRPSSLQHMNPGAKTHGIEDDPLRYPWFKYECFLISG